MSTKTAAVCGALILFAGAGAALADATLTYQSPRTGSSTVMIHNGMVRMTTPQPGGGGSSVSIFDSHKGRFIVLDEARRSYIAMDKATISEQAKRMKEMQAQMMAQMRERMKDMPAEQRQMMEQQMAQFEEGRSRPMPKVEIRKTGKTEVVNGFRCTVYQSYIDGKPASEACVADPKSLGLSPQDYQAIKDMFAFMADMAQTVSGSQGRTPQGFEEVPGLPVRTRAPGGETMELKRVETRPLDDQLFRIPAGYQKAQPMQGFGPGQGPRR